MVELVVNDIKQLSLLEMELIDKGILYRLVLHQTDIGIEPPYLIVDGVPIDMERSFKWIEGQHNDENNI